MKVSFWFFVAAILLIYGVILVGTGVYYIAMQAALPSLYYPSIWWGVVMLVSGGIFLYINKRSC